MARSDRSDKQKVHTDLWTSADPENPCPFTDAQHNRTEMTSAQDATFKKSGTSTN